MGLMLPDKRMSDKGLDGKMACMSLNGYSDCARATVDLDEILNSIKENLRLEQKHVMEMNFVTMHRLLSPIQVPAPTSIFDINLNMYFLYEYYVLIYFIFIGARELLGQSIPRVSFLSAGCCFRDWDCLPSETVCLCKADQFAWRGKQRWPLWQALLAQQ